MIIHVFKLCVCVRAFTTLLDCYTQQFVSHCVFHFPGLLPVVVVLVVSRGLAPYLLLPLHWVLTNGFFLLFSPQLLITHKLFYQHLCHLRYLPKESRLEEFVIGLERFTPSFTLYAGFQSEHYMVNLQVSHLHNIIITKLPMALYLLTDTQVHTHTHT